MKESGSGGRSDFFRVCKEWSDLSTPNYNHSFTGQRREYRGRVRLRNRTNFQKSAKGVRGSFSFQKFILQILGTLNRAFFLSIKLIQRSNFNSIISLNTDFRDILRAIRSCRGQYLFTAFFSIPAHWNRLDCHSDEAENNFDVMIQSGRTSLECSLWLD